MYCSKSISKAQQGWQLGAHYHICKYGNLSLSPQPRRVEMRRCEKNRTRVRGWELGRAGNGERGEKCGCLGGLKGRRRGRGCTKSSGVQHAWPGPVGLLRICSLIQREFLPFEINSAPRRTPPQFPQKNRRCPEPPLRAGPRKNPLIGGKIRCPVAAPPGTERWSCGRILTVTPDLLPCISKPPQQQTPKAAIFAAHTLDRGFPCRNKELPPIL